MSRKLLVISIVVTVALFVLLGMSLFGQGFKTSPRILYLTQPVYSFTGTVVSLTSNSITIAKDTVLARLPDDLSPTRKPEHIVYTVRITDKTNLNQQMIPGDYLDKTGLQFGQNKPSLANVKKGDIVSATTRTDLRTLTGNTFEAVSIELSPLVKIVTGTIVSREAKRIVIRAMPFVPPGAVDANNVSFAAMKEKTYAITLSENTKVMKNTITTDITTQNKPEKVSADTLKKDMSVTLYTNNPVDGTGELTALYVEYTDYQIAPLTSPVPPAASNAATTTP